jgi:N utilization substance protein B
MAKSRHKARELALQGLYQWLVGGNAVADILSHLRETEDFAQADEGYLTTLLAGVTAQQASLDALLVPKLDRDIARLSPIEHAILLMGAYEAQHCPEVPYRVVIDEAVELAKRYGGTDGHKYVNGVLDKLVAELRPAEVARARAS